MLEKFSYTNNVNETISYGTSGLYANISDLRDYVWQSNITNNRITSFYRGVVEKTIPLVIHCDTEEKGIAMKNRIYEIADKDVLSLQPGILSIGEYSLKCFITGSKKQDYLRDKRCMEIEITIMTDKAQWFKATDFTFNMKGTGTSVEELDYPYDYPHDFLSEVQGDILSNPNFIASNFRLTIYGFATAPIVYVDDHAYSVDVTISTGEYLAIDSRDKTIMLTRYNGAKQNCFNQRNKDSYIFQKIATGNHIITCSGDLEFTITLYDERSEPKWI